MLPFSLFYVCLSPGQVFFASLNSPQGEKQGSLGHMPVDLLPGCRSSTRPFFLGTAGPARPKVAWQPAAHGEADDSEMQSFSLRPGIHTNEFLVRRRVLNEPA